jgi:hypothetical protein
MPSGAVRLMTSNTTFKAWLARLITRRVPLARWREAFEQRPGDIKVVVDFSEA